MAIVWIDLNAWAVDTSDVALATCVSVWRICGYDTRRGQSPDGQPPRSDVVAGEDISLRWNSLIRKRSLSLRGVS